MIDSVACFQYQNNYVMVSNGQTFTYVLLRPARNGKCTKFGLNLASLRFVLDSSGGGGGVNKLSVAAASAADASCALETCTQ